MNDFDISVHDLSTLDIEQYSLIDIRDSLSYSYGNIPGSKNIPTDTLYENYEKYLGKKLIIYCKKGEISMDLVAFLRDKGLEAWNLKGGYLKWLMEHISLGKNNQGINTISLDASKSIQKKFRKDIWCKFSKAVRDYELVKEGDKIAICISGGKDSMLMAMLFQELKRHNKFKFDMEFLVMDPGYNHENRQIIEDNAKKLDIPITVFESDIFETVLHVDRSPCYLCARMRRGHLYSKAKELGCNKIALGHHYDDVIETILMGMLYGSQIQTMMPKLHSSNFEGMELIRPMYLIREDDIKKWRDYNNLYFIQCACKFTDTCSIVDGKTSSKRMEIKKLIATMKESNPYVEGNIFKSVENVNLATIIAYKKDGVKHHFLDDYDNI